MGEVRWTDEAEWWLREIHTHIAADSPEAALKTVRGIMGKARSLSDTPHRGYRPDESSEREIGVVLYGHFRIAYLVKANDDVDILGIFHGALDLQRYLSRE